MPKEEKKPDLLSKPVDLKHLLDQLAIPEDELQEAAVEQPRLYLEASRWRSMKLRRMAGTHTQFHMARADVAVKLRRANEGGKKVYTEGSIEDHCNADPKIIALRQQMDEADALEEYSKGLLEAYRQRMAVIKILADIRNSEMAYEIRQVKSNMAKADLVKKARELQDSYTGYEEPES